MRRGVALYPLTPTIMALGVVSHQVERSCVLMHKAHGW